MSSQSHVELGLFEKQEELGVDSFIWGSSIVGGLSLLNVVDELDLPGPLGVISARTAR